MALDDIFKALERQAERDVEELLAEARARAASLVNEAEIEAATIRRSHATEAESTAAVRTTRSLNSARLEARRRLAAVRQQAIKVAFDEAKSRLSTVRSRSDYERLLAGMLDEALEGVKGDYEVLVDARDRELTERLLRERGSSAAVRPELESSGGVVVAQGGDRVFRRNTLEDRFDKFTGLAQSDVARILFS